MNTKNILVSFLLIASVLLLTANVSAFEIDDSYGVRIDGVNYSEADLVVGDSVEVSFKLVNNGTDAKDVVVKVELGDETAEKSLGRLGANKAEKVVLTIPVSADFKKSSLEKDLSFEITVEDDEDDWEFEGLNKVTVYRADYEVSIKSISTSSVVEAGESMSVNVVLRNTGYYDMEDVFVTISVPELGIAKSVYFGDMVNVAYGDDLDEDDEDADDTVTGTIVLSVPSSVKSGVYTLQVDAETDDSKDTATKELKINNAVPEIAIKSGSDLILLNPSNKLTVYTVKYLSNEEVVIIPAASSKTIAVVGDGEFDVTVYNGETLLSTVKFEGETLEMTSPAFVLTVVLAVVFLVLLVVLVVLLTKKPQKAEEFGESYY